MSLRRVANSAMVRVPAGGGGDGLAGEDASRPLSQLRNPIEMLSAGNEITGTIRAMCFPKKRARAETHAHATLRSDAISETLCYGGSRLDPADETSARALHLSSAKAAR